MSTIVVGPIAHSISDIRYFFTAVVQAEPWYQDPKVIELPWRERHIEAVKGRPLVFGIIKWDHLVTPHPPVQRGMRIVKEALQKQGHDLVEFEVPDSEEASKLIVKFHFHIKLTIVTYLCHGQRKGYIRCMCTIR